MKMPMTIFSASFLLLSAGTAPAQEPPVAEKSVQAGTTVSLRGEDFDLYPGSLETGDDFLALLKDTDLEFPFHNRVTVVSIVPSVDTPVCEIQTHSLAEIDLAPGIERVTVSRDLPMAQSRFAKDAGLDNITYVSDYKSGSFGRMSGLLIKEKELLARAVLVLDDNGIVRYLQIVPEVSHLPDMKKAAAFANALVATPGKKDLVACTMEAMLCPDGSYVGRRPPDCEFAKCPGE